MNEHPWNPNAPLGTKVAFLSPSGRTIVTSIARVTKTQFVTEYGANINRTTQRVVGSSFAHAYMPTEKGVREIEEKDEKRRLVRSLITTQWAKLSLAQLRHIHAHVPHDVRPEAFL